MKTRLLLLFAVIIGMMANGKVYAEEAGSAISSDLKTARTGEVVYMGIMAKASAEHAGKEVRTEFLIRSNGVDFAAWKPQYFEPTSESWNDWTASKEGEYLFGPFTLQSGTSYFRITPLKAGVYTYVMNVWEKDTDRKTGKPLFTSGELTLTVSGTDRGNPYVVTGAGSVNYASLYTAVMWANAGSVIKVPNGTYDLKPGTELFEGQPGWFLPISKTLTIEGESRDGVKLMSTHPVPNGSYSSQNFVTVFAENVVLRNLTITSKKEVNSRPLKSSLIIDYQ